MKHYRDKCVSRVEYYTKHAGVRFAGGGPPVFAHRHHALPPVPPPALRPRAFLTPSPPNSTRTPAQLLRTRYREATSAGRAAEAAAVARRVQDALMLLKVANAAERKARDNLHALESAQLSSEIFHATAAMTGLLKQVTAALPTPEEIEAVEVDRLAEMKKVDDCYRAMMGGEEEAASSGASAEEVDAYLAALREGEPQLPAVPVPVPIQVGGAAAVPQPLPVRQSSRVVAQRQLVEA